MPPTTRAKGPTLSHAQIDAIFEEARTQESYLLGLHMAVIPHFEEVKKLEGYVCCSEELWKYIAEKAFAFDKEWAPNVLPGGAWLNWGFSGSDKSVTGHQIKLPAIRYKEAPVPVPV
jgi:hypothetical protein